MFKDGRSSLQINDSNTRRGRRSLTGSAPLPAKIFPPRRNKTTSVGFTTQGANGWGQEVRRSIGMRRLPAISLDPMKFLQAFAAGLRAEFADAACAPVPE